MGLEIDNKIPLEIPEKVLLRRICKLENPKISQRLKKKIKNAIREIYDHAQPKAVFNIFTVQRKNGSVILDEKTALHSKKLASVLSDSQRAALFLTTVGSEVDRIINQQMKTRPHYGYLLDTAASVAAESAAQHVQDYIEDNLEEDEKVTLRYSPGYCDWPLDEQKKLFKILPHDRIGIKLSKNCFMSPHKSISGVIGICPADSLRPSRNVCQDCTKFDCPHRRTPKEAVN